MEVYRFIGQVISIMEDNPKLNKLLESVGCEYDAVTYFMRGGCYELVKIVKHFYKDSRIVLREDDEHCAIEYQGVIYDAFGIVIDPEKYHLATSEDIEYMERGFGLAEAYLYDNGVAVTVSEYLIKNFSNVLDNFIMGNKENIINKR